MQKLICYSACPGTLQSLLDYLGESKYLIGQNFGGQNFRRTKFFGGQNFRHHLEISAVLSAENFLSVLCFNMSLILF